VRLSLTIEVE